MTDIDQEWITVAEAADLTGKPPVTIRRWAREGDIEAIKSGSVWLVRRLDVLEVAQAGPGPKIVSDLTQDPVGTLTQAWKRVGRDVERDDLPDIVDHADFAADAVDEIQRIAGLIANGYQPSPVRRIEMPKTLLVSRPLAELTIEDRLVYEACVQTLAPSIDARLHQHVYNHRLVKKLRGSRLVRFFGAQFRKFEEYITGPAWVTTNARFCLKTDISSFYEYVDHETLLETLDARPEHRDIVDLLGRLLRGWRKHARVVGLPQGPDASGILANAYLTEVDSVCQSRSLAYARFSDDLRVLFGSEEEARRFAPALIEPLRHLGLNLATVKTQIVPMIKLITDQNAARRAMANYKVEDHNPASLDDLRAIFDDAVAKAPNGIDITDFRFSVWRLGLLEDDYCLERLLELLPVVPYAANIVADYLSRLGYKTEVAVSVTDYLLSPDNVHQWTELHFLRLVGTFDAVDARLLDRIRLLAFQDSGPRGDMAARVLGAVGEPLDRRRLRQHATRTDVEPSRRRAAIIGGVDPAIERTWIDELVTDEHPQIRRAARFVAKQHHIPPTLVRRRIPQWVRPLREKLERQGRLPRRAA